MKKYLKITAIVGVLIMAVSLTGCTTFDNFRQTFFPDKDTKNAIKIGVMEPLSGEFSKFGKDELNGIKLAHSMKDTVKGRKVQLLIRDTQSSVYVADDLAEELIKRKPVAIIGSYGDAVTMTASKHFEEAKIPAISPSAANPLITDNSDYYFRLNFTDTGMGQAAGEFLYKGLGVTRVGIIRVEGDEADAELLRQMRKTFRELTDDETSVTNYDIRRGQHNYEDVLKLIKKDKLKAVFADISLEDADKLLAVATRLKMTDVTFVGPPTWYGEDLVNLSRKYPKIALATGTDFNPDTKGEKDKLHEKFVKKYEKEYGREPGEEAARGFDSYMLLVDALEKDGLKGGNQLREQLLKTKEFNGVSGHLTFNEKGEPYKTVQVDVIKNGKSSTMYSTDMK